jgi:hypothetical protein
MTFDLQCLCGALFHVTAEEMDDRLWLLIQRFTNAHVTCGFMTAVAEDKIVPTQQVSIKIIKEL